ncbi:Leucine-rich repeat receptor protein kinase EMS1 [Vitis vinifera]|uniref:non-specific serine/threonine protein kinase n=1 Tax=Vitis vinifera TaxID=29760 RepID=A0A438CX25_VITVI|nr:Leucine-rich repeat receptor protein kinase EMS1 [Vitis vinifera]
MELYRFSLSMGRCALPERPSHLTRPPYSIPRGALSPSLFSLSSLIVLDLSGNLFSGHLSPDIAGLRRLKHLLLGDNELSGEIPRQLDLTWLRSLDLSGNSLTGDLPTQIGNLTHLRLLDVANNLLSGPLSPTLFTNLQSLISLDVSNNSFSGNIPPEIGNLKSLTDLYIGINHFSGQLPPEIGNLSSLQNFFSPSCSIRELDNTELCLCELNGSIPAELGKCRNLKTLMLSFNSISGSLPEELSELPMLSFSAEKNQLSGPLPSWLGKWNGIDSLLLSKSLMEIDLDSNFLSGGIDDTFLKCKNLTQLVLVNNQIVGSIPEYLSELPLMVLDLDSNNFTGSIPVSLWNLVSLMEFSAANNLLEGSLPPEIGNAVALRGLFLVTTGIIPMELGDCISLTTLDLGNNLLNGSIPDRIADLAQLQCLVLSHNDLSGSIPSKPSSYFRQVNIPDSSFVQHHGVYDLSYNRLSGSIPEELGSCVVVVDLLLSNNFLSGEIPISLSRLTNLTTLDLSGNLLTGSIPLKLGYSLKLQGLYLGNNQLTGTIPESLGRLSSLVKLNLTGNQLSGSIPFSFGNLTGLTHFDLSSNELDGELPSALSSMVNLVGLYVQQNRLSGQVSKLFMNSIAWRIETLNLSWNFFNGGLPRSLGNLSYLTNLDLHHNMFTGEIPTELGDLMQLEYFDVSGIVVGCTLITLTIAFGLRKWVIRNSRQSDTEEIEESKLNSSIDQNLYFLSSSRSKEPLSINVAMFEQPLLKLTLVDILEATNNFCKTNVIGDGGFGTVYKAALPNGKIVAVKKLNQAKTQGHREFLAEMETLGKVKHRNLVPLLGYCSFGEEKFLVYEYMVNGSLDLWLRNRTGALEALDWTKRFKIAMGAARGLAFLHHGFIPHIIHRDIKASNILLNEDFEAKVADFGLARLISACETHVSTDIAGTFGYIPPEYGQSWRSTTRGDVYSFGVILLELVTGKEPTGPDFKDFEGGNLVGWVFEKMRKGEAAEVLDPTVVRAELKHIMLQILQIAAICLSENPAKRPTMLHVLKFLKGIKDE